MVFIHHPRSWNLFGSMASLNWGFLRQVLATSSETFARGIMTKMSVFMMMMMRKKGDGNGDNEALMVIMMIMKHCDF